MYKYHGSSQRFAPSQSESYGRKSFSPPRPPQKRGMVCAGISGTEDVAG